MRRHGTVGLGFAVEDMIRSVRWPSSVVVRNVEESERHAVIRLDSRRSSFSIVPVLFICSFYPGRRRFVCSSAQVRSTAATADGTRISTIVRWTEMPRYEVRRISRPSSLGYPRPPAPSRLVAIVIDNRSILRQFSSWMFPGTVEWVAAGNE